MMRRRALDDAAEGRGGAGMDPVDVDRAGAVDPGRGRCPRMPRRAAGARPLPEQRGPRAYRAGAAGTYAGLRTPGAARPAPAAVAETSTTCVDRGARGRGPAVLGHPVPAVALAVSLVAAVAALTMNSLRQLLKSLYVQGSVLLHCYSAN